MPDSTQQLIFKLVIDNDEAVAVLDLTKGQFIETGEAAEETNEQIRKSYQELTTAQRQLLPGQQYMNDAVIKFASAISDAGMFMDNTRVGMRALAQNLSSVVHGFIQAKQAAGGQASVMQLLTNSIMGGGGLNIGINALMLVMQLLPDLFKDSGEKAKDASSFLDEFIKSHQSLETQLQKDIYKTESLSLKELNELYIAANKELKEFNKLRSGPELAKPIGGRRLTKEAQDFLIAISKGTPELTEEQKRLQNTIDATDELANGIKGVIDGNMILMRALGMTDNQFEAVQKRLIEFAKDSPFYIKSALKVGKEEFQLTGQEAKKLADQINDLLNRQSKEDKFVKAKQSAVEKFIEGETRQMEAARLYGLTYSELLTELENAEKDYSDVIKKLRNTEDQRELDSVLTFADLTKERITIIKDYLYNLRDEMGDIDDEMKRYAKEIEINLIKDEEDRQEFEKDKEKFLEELRDRMVDEINTEEEKILKLLDLYYNDVANIEEKERHKTDIEAYYANLRLQKEFDYYQQKIGQIQGAYGQIYNIISQNVSQEINEWKTKEEKKLDAERDAALKHARTEAQRDKINENYQVKKEALEIEANKRAQERLEVWFNMQKALAMAEISINLAKAIAVEWGKLGILAAITQGLVIATLTAQLAVVAAQKFPKGFESGGRLPKGKAGIFEGTANEIVAPESDFKTYSAELVRQALIEARNYISVTSGTSSYQDLKAIKGELVNLKQAIIDRPARAFLDDREAKKIVIRGGAMNRRSKI
jgi:hypothetical protein